MQEENWQQITATRRSGEVARQKRGVGALIGVCAVQVTNMKPKAVRNSGARERESRGGIPTLKSAK